MNVRECKESVLDAPPADRYTHVIQNRWHVTGCSLAAKAPALGAGDRGFKSLHPDNAPIAQLDRATAF